MHPNYRAGIVKSFVWNRSTHDSLAKGEQNSKRAFPVEIASCHWPAIKTMNYCAASNGLSNQDISPLFPRIEKPGWGGWGGGGGGVGGVGGGD